ncbi:pullulanase [Proteinivorax tanatarense]|uniref:Pullulanase n=1 Tax=Proteinivorax tanatarense TaxID=1260629 RepID=A0AAU7VJA8_9FIRM
MINTYSGPLGPRLNKDGSATIKVWSPKADNVSIILYDKHDQNKIIKNDLKLMQENSGVWKITLNTKNTGLTSLRGYYYHFKITHGSKVKVALDPYAKSMAAWNHHSISEKYPYGKAAIIDPATLGPKLSFANIPGFKKREDAIIYEVHVRDFTSDPFIESDLTSQFGTFKAFIDKLDYIKALGITHIQLLPIMSYFFRNELENNKRILQYQSYGTNYNWGYDPHSYFSVSGMYSEDPNDPELRISELKQLISEIHNRNMGVILDVVYNHTADVGILENLVPNYYHFMDKDGTPRTSFGGGRLGTTHKMSRKILVDSILYWTDEFKVDGFRFDMMGDHDSESIQIAYDEAKKLNPNILMIGEGWRTYVGDEGDDVMPADQDWMEHTNAVGCFSDEFRDELKSGFGHEGTPRFLTGGARNIKKVFDNIKAEPHNFSTTSPGDVVPYIEAHDNLTLYDVIAYSIKKDPDIPENDLEIHKRIRLGNTMLLTSQGIAFIHAGQEYGRTKQYKAKANEAPYKSTYMTDENNTPFKFPYFIHDSYQSSDAINKFEWQKVTDDKNFSVNTDTQKYTEGLIHLRRSTDAFRLGCKNLIESNVSLITCPNIKETDLVIAYSCKSTDGQIYYVFINADNKERKLSLNVDLTEKVVLADQKQAGTKAISNPVGFLLTKEDIKIDPLTSVVFKA